MSARRASNPQKVDTKARAKVEPAPVVSGHLPQVKEDQAQEVKGDSRVLGVTGLLQELVDFGMERIRTGEIDLRAGDVIKAMGLLLQYRIEPDVAADLAKALQEAKSRREAQLKRITRKKKKEKIVDAEFEVIDGR
jgi:hypothetical protein